MELLIRWIAGLAAALILGAGTTGWLIGRVRAYFNIPKAPGREVPSWLTGLVERLFFTLIIAFDVSGAAIAMIGWIALKLVPNWELYVKHGTANKPLVWSSLLGSLCSMFFALIGGLICRGVIWWWPSG